MIEKYRERTIRAIIASLLGSGISTQELRRLSDDLQSSSFSFDLARLLNKTLDVLEDGYTKPYGSYRISSYAEKPSETAMIKRVKNRKLTKEQTFQLISQVAGPIDQFLNPRSTIGDIVSDFYKRSSSEQRAQFMSLLDVSAMPDPYLKGLANRK